MTHSTFRNIVKLEFEICCGDDGAIFPGDYTIISGYFYSGDVEISGDSFAVPNEEGFNLLDHLGMVNVMLIICIFAIFATWCLMIGLCTTIKWNRLLGRVHAKGMIVSMESDISESEMEMMPSGKEERPFLDELSI